jgi:hypothetical protein
LERIAPKKALQQINWPSFPAGKDAQQSPLGDIYREKMANEPIGLPFPRGKMFFEAIGQVFPQEKTF